MNNPEPIWRPDAAHLARARITAFERYVAQHHGIQFGSYLELWRWSVDHLREFWSAVWGFFEISGDDTPCTVLDEQPMPHATWFPGTRLNYAEYALRCGADADPAVIAVSEDGASSVTSWGELRAHVAAVADWLRQNGIRPGDRVVGYLPNTTPTLVAFLAAASLGAVWSVCAQDYSAAGASARLRQLEPTVLLAADGYRWNGTHHDRRAEASALRDALPTVRHAIFVPNVGLAPPAGTWTQWADVTAVNADLRFDRLQFDAPLWVLFSSGTTGLPKGIVHGHGGVLLEHYKSLGLHFDVGPSKPLFWYTSTNWMMWNVVVSGLLLGAPIVLYDGSPTYPDPLRLWAIAAQHHVGVLGVSPGYLAASIRADIEPGNALDLTGLKILGVTGAPLSSAPYTWVRDAVGSWVQVASSTGGTDVVSGFAGSAPSTPVWPGEISAPALGVALDSWDSSGHPVVEQVGELVVTKPMPSMPVSFWNDPIGEKYRESYFTMFPGVWRHGDWMSRTARGSVVVSGRSDSTLNRHGVRLGTADIYAVVDRLEIIRESLVIGVEQSDGGYWLALFVVLADGVDLAPETVAFIKQAIASQASPRHAPDDVIAVERLPHTRTGKKLEIPVKRLIQGHPLEEVASPDAVDDIEALAQFVQFRRAYPERQSRDNQSPNACRC